MQKLETQDQWLKLVEYGDHSHQEGIQRVTKDSAIEMQKKFRSLKARLSRKFGGVPIYIGHPDDKVFSHLPGHSDTRAYAWVKDIEARDDGLWVLPKWSDVGKKIIDNAFFKFLSPRWKMKSLEKNVFIPVQLLSIGLTNNPNILGDTIANQRLNDRENEADASDYDGQGYFQKILSILKIEPQMNLQEIEEYLMKIMESSQKWESDGQDLLQLNDELRDESERFYKIACEREQLVQELQHKLSVEQKLSSESFIEYAITRGFIKADEAGLWREKFLANSADAYSEIYRKNCPLNIESKTENLRSNFGSGKDHILMLVDERMNVAGENYTEAWNSVKKQYPGLF